MSISNEDINNNHVKTLSTRVGHLINYVNVMVTKDKKSGAEIYPIEMTKFHKDFIIKHLQYINNDLLGRA